MFIPKVLSIAGSDSGGGAGIQADLKTMTAMGCYGITVVTAVTAQNTLGVNQIELLSAELIASQFHAVMNDYQVNAIKIGMIGQSKSIPLLQQLLQKNPQNIVLDPVMVATSGAALASEPMSEMMIDQLFPISRVITPNLIEAQTFLNRPAITSSEMVDVAMELIGLGANAVLLKGGHLEDEQLRDVLVEKDGRQLQVTEFTHERIATLNTHGTGCTLSSAIACGLAHNKSLSQAVAEGIEFTQGAILAASKVLNKQLGSGNGSLWHAYKEFPIA